MKSMTGYGCGEAASNTVKVTVEMSAVNRKQCDIVINLPRAFNELEAHVKQAVSNAVSRGRVSVYVTIESIAGSQSSLKVDDHLATEYYEALRLLGKIWGTELELKPSDLLRAPGVFNVQETQLEIEAVEPLLDQAAALAVIELQGMQEREGAALKADLTARLKTLRRIAKAIAKQAPAVKEYYRTQLHRRIQELQIDVSFEDERLLKEIGIFAERSDITEELTRLESHFKQFTRYFSGAEPAGRALDFLCQETHREFNTIGSKANDAFIAQKIVEAKTELEKVREQVQNVQ